MRNFIVNHSRCKVRIIVFDPGTIVTHGHRLLDYAGDLSSFVEIRKAGDEFREYNGALFIADDIAYVHRNHAERYEGLANFNDRREAHFLLKQFNRMWDTAVQDSNLRRMRI